ncbi:hypothetical protein CDD82_7044 [Ophiocordyceps australis]|uniref:Major facilitator superfamily (MFS) profile domain-containing protein n=1 Tax=Ophiocordyceps australis TaxID=1399860 RepID=A0A2C5YM24_9HYPO|nr:hypothetical protein CDD82_7044 [Ophiocordyceps australis]
MVLLIFVLLYLITLTESIASSVEYNLAPYITSSFKHHGLLVISGIVVVVVNGVFNLAVAKIIDIWGRAQGFAIMFAIALAGMLLTTTSQNVQMYAAGDTLHWIGSRGFNYIIDIMLVDMTSLRNYLITVGIRGTPTLASTFAGPPLAQAFITRP